jgi:hypothetical protein
MLLFASAVLLQLSEDNYLTHLIAQHLDDLSKARKNLQQAFKKILNESAKNSVCFSAANTKMELENFWSANQSCNIIISGVSVNYVLQDFQQEKQEKSYVQYSLRIKTQLTSTWLRVVVEQQSNHVVAWSYDL